MTSPGSSIRLLIGLASDRPGAGKSTAADHLIRKHGFHSISIGAVVKDELDKMLQVHGFRYKEELKEEFRPALSWWTEFRLKHTSADYWLEQAITQNPDQDSVLIPDVRYPNEAEYIKAHGGLIIKIDRPSVARSTLQSEVALDNYEFDYIINNDQPDDGASMFAALETILRKRA